MPSLRVALASAAFQVCLRASLSPFGAYDAKAAADDQSISIDSRACQTAEAQYPQARFLQRIFLNSVNNKFHAYAYIYMYIYIYVYIYMYIYIQVYIYRYIYIFFYIQLKYLRGIGPQGHYKIKRSSLGKCSYIE